MRPVRSMPASVEFYEKLGFEIEVRRDDWGWARLRCGDCRVMLDQSINLHAGIPTIAALSLYVDDVVDLHRRARHNGLSLPDPTATIYHMTEFRNQYPGHHPPCVVRPREPPHIANTVCTERARASAERRH